MNFIIVLCLSLIIILLYYNLKKIKQTKEIDKTIEEKNQLALREYENIQLLKEKTTEEIEDMKKTLSQLAQIARESQLSADAAIEHIRNAVACYGDTLDGSYSQMEQEYDKLIQNLYNSYENTQDELLDEIQEEQEKLEYLRTTRAATIQAQLKEKEIKEKMSFYSLQPSESEKDDIRALERVKPNLHQPRILCMLIWSTYFQKPMTALCNNVLGTAIVSGIYKITNQETNECYIGQAVDVAKRWKDHAKCGLGIDTPANNKLYKAIQEYGIWNFSWELLESCSKELLNEKEIYYIDLYDSKNYGYNSSIGIKKY
jgi:hypothetical protein